MKYESLEPVRALLDYSIMRVGMFLTVKLNVLGEETCHPCNNHWTLGIVLVTRAASLTVYDQTNEASTEVNEFYIEVFHPSSTLQESCYYLTVDRRKVGARSRVLCWQSSHCLRVKPCRSQTQFCLAANYSIIAFTARTHLQMERKEMCSVLISLPNGSLFLKR